MLNSFLSHFYLNSFSRQQKQSCSTCQLQWVLLIHAWVRVIHGRSHHARGHTAREHEFSSTEQSSAIRRSARGEGSHACYLCWRVTGLTFEQSWADQHSYCKFQSTMILSCTGEAIVCFTLLDLWLLRSFCPHFLWCSLSPGEKDYNINVPSIAEKFTILLLCILISFESLY